MRNELAELPFDEVRAWAYGRIVPATMLVHQLAGYGPRKTLLRWRDILIWYASRIEKSKGPIFSLGEVRSFRALANTLIGAHAQTRDQLEAFWRLHDDALRVAGVDGRPSISLAESIYTYLDHWDRASDFAGAMWQEIDPTEGIPSPSALLLLNAVRVDTLEYMATSQIQKIATDFRLDGFDPVRMCTVGEAVPKGKHTRTVARAVRDATAHARLRVDRSSGRAWSVTFSNHEGGYAFERTYSHKEFEAMARDHFIIYMTQITLLLVMDTLTVSANRLFAPACSSEPSSAPELQSGEILFSDTILRSRPNQPPPICPEPADPQLLSLLWKDGGRSALGKP